MDAQRPVDSPTVRAHKRQLAWQILVPFLVAAVLILAAGVLAATSIGSVTRTWADISIIWLIAPMLLLALLLAAVLGCLIYGIAILLKVTPRYSIKAQYYAAAASAVTRKASDGAAKPFIWIRQAGKVIKSIFKL